MASPRCYQCNTPWSPAVSIQESGSASAPGWHSRRGCLACPIGAMTARESGVFLENHVPHVEKDKDEGEGDAADSPAP